MNDPRNTVAALFGPHSRPESHLRRERNPSRSISKQPLRATDSDGLSFERLVHQFAMGNAGKNALASMIEIYGLYYCIELLGYRQAEREPLS